MDERRSGLPRDLAQMFERHTGERLTAELRARARQLQRTVGVPAGPAMRDYAEHLGYVILQAAEVDLRIAAVASLLHSGDAGYRGDLLSLSGAQLVTALRAAPDIASTEFDDFVGRYEAAYLRRNHIVHAIRPHGDRNADPERFERTVRVLRGGSKWISSLNDAQMQIEIITVEDLIRFELELQELNFSASNWFKAFKEDRCDRDGRRSHGQP